jgi:RNA polymerase-binding transcription factor
MPAKKPAPKAAKGKKAASRPAAVRKTTAAAAARKPAERLKASAAAPVLRKSAVPPAPRKTPPPTRPNPSTTEETIEMRKASPQPAPEATAKEAPSAPNQIPVPPRATSAPAAAHSSAQVSQATDNDDNDSAEPGSLLAGPRNVQPYIAKRGEQYMSKEQSEHFRNILNSWKRDLMVEVDRTVTHMKDEAANFPDPNDRATQEEEFSLELRTRDRERKLIRKIDEAIKRIEDGSYGYCLETGEEIGIKRLEARPVATLSIEAQERRERRERQYGDRDDRYR